MPQVGWRCLRLNMLRMSLELSKTNKIYEESAAKFFRHFLNIAWAMHHIGKKDISLWDDQDNFYYDVVEMSSWCHRSFKSTLFSGCYTYVCSRNYA